jgi:hypothetical protein
MMPFRIKKGLVNYGIVYFITERVKYLTVWARGRRKAAGGKGSLTHSLNE